MPERLEYEVLQKGRYINPLTFTFTFTFKTHYNATHMSVLVAGVLKSLATASHLCHLGVLLCCRVSWLLAVQSLHIHSCSQIYTVFSQDIR